MRIPFICLIAAAGLALSGCAYGDLGGLSVGLGYGSPYSSYGYGYGSPYGGYGYGSPYGGYGGYGGYYGSPYFGYGSSGYSPYGYSSPYFGWYDGYYYPGSGYYVYDSYRRPRLWSDSQRSYWSTRQQRAAKSGTAAPRTPQWSGFSSDSDRTISRRADRQVERAARREQRAQERPD